MDVETPTGGTDRIEGFAPERKKTSCRGTLAELNLEGLCPFQWNVGLGRPRTSSRRFMTSYFLHDVLADGQGSLARVAGWRSPRRATVLLQEASFSLKGANVTLERR
jgi:hypothetical protein